MKLFFILALLTQFSFGEDTVVKEVERPSTLGCQRYQRVQQEEARLLREKREELTRLAKSPSSIENYKKARQIWINLTSKVYIAGSFDAGEVSQKLTQEGKSKEAITKCNESLEETRSVLRKAALLVFGMASRLRIREINFQRSLPESTIFGLTTSFLEDHLLEIKVIPLRWYAIFSNKIDRFDKDLESGRNGQFRVAQDVALLAIFLLSLLALIWASLRFSEVSAGVRQRLLKYLYSTQGYIKLARLVQKLHGYLPWILLIFIIDFQSKLITNTYFSDLSVLLPYLTYYAYYKIFKFSYLMRL
jgi:hypothetical protein